MSNSINPVPQYAMLGTAAGHNNPGAVQRPYSVMGTINDVRIIPEFGTCGNNILSHGLGNQHMNGGYFSLCSAYPGCSKSNGCNAPHYVGNLCNNNNANQNLTVQMQQQSQQQAQPRSQADIQKLLADERVAQHKSVRFEENEDGDMEIISDAPKMFGNTEQIIRYPGATGATGATDDTNPDPMAQ